MDSKEAYCLEEIKLKVAEIQKEANEMLAKAKKTELEIEKLKLKEQAQVTNVLEYLINCDFGKSFEIIYSFNNKKSYQQLEKELESLVRGRDEYAPQYLCYTVE